MSRMKLPVASYGASKRNSQKPTLLRTRLRRVASPFIPAVPPWRDGVSWRRRIKLIGFLCLCLSLVSGACLNLKQPRNKVAFYTLEYDPPLSNGGPPLPVSIRMAQFSVAPLYNTNAIIYREGSYTRSAYAYHKWRANPGDLVTYFLARDMKASGLFKAVPPRDARLAVSHTLEGSLDEFFEWDEEDSWRAVLTLSVTLVLENEPDISKGVLYQKTYRSVEKCSHKNPQALAEAMSRAMSKASKQIIEDVRRALTGASPGGSP